MIGSQGSSVSIATNDGIDKSGFDSRKGKDIFFSQKCPNRLGDTHTIIISVGSFHDSTAVRCKVGYSSA
jgi:hypothetical protein